MRSSNGSFWEYECVFKESEAGEGDMNFGGIGGFIGFCWTTGDFTERPPNMFGGFNGFGGSAGGLGSSSFLKNMSG